MRAVVLSCSVLEGSHSEMQLVRGLSDGDEYALQVEGEISSIVSAFADQGVRLEVGHDFRQLSELVSNAERLPLLRQFDPDGDLNESVQSFWICGYDAAGLVFTSALQLLDLRDSSVAEYIASHRLKLIPSRPSVDPETALTFRGPKAGKLSGWVVYHGEVWLREDFRGEGNAHLVVRIGALSATLIWDPDAIFGLMNWALACDGFNNRIGYTYTEMMASVFKKVADGSPHQIWTVFADRDDLKFMLNLPAVGFARSLGNKFR